MLLNNPQKKGRSKIMVPELWAGMNYVITYNMYYSPNLKYKTKNIFQEIWILTGVNMNIRSSGM
jgi:hypothetical protein